jgi:lipoate-protein ligase A
MEIRLIFDRPAAGDWNMGMDEALLQSVGRAGQGGCLRFYLWNEPTLSLGYFQRHADRTLHPPSRDCPMVRRSTGGGAIIHAAELTYSFVVPVKRHRDERTSELYLTFHQALIEELASRSISSTLCGKSTSQFRDCEPFLCFLRRAEADVLSEGHKVAGSAQRRWRLGLLQHGSILLKTTPKSPELAGIEDLSGRSVDAFELAERWANRIGERLKLPLRLDRPTDEEILSAERWVQDKFSHQDWNFKR